jgi:hypothetical protein
MIVRPFKCGSRQVSDSVLLRLLVDLHTNLAFILVDFHRLLIDQLIASPDTRPPGAIDERIVVRTHILGMQPCNAERRRGKDTI